MECKLLTYPTETDWLEVKKNAFVTVGKDTEKAPDLKWKHKILVARHSPIRDLIFRFELKVPYCVSNHLVRHHEGFQPYVQSQRNDRQSDYDRNAARQDAEVTMRVTLNAEALMVLANKRLCRQASEETRKIVQMMCLTVLDTCPEFIGLLVPMCEYHGCRCHEMRPCGRYPYDGMGDAE